MKRFLILTAALVLIAVGAWLYFVPDYVAQQEKRELYEKFQVFAEGEGNPTPSTGLEGDWVRCLERLASQVPARQEAQKTQRIVCRSWTMQGVTSTLVALRTRHDLVPVVESRLEDQAEDRGVIVEVTGGTGGPVFYSDPAITPEFLTKTENAGLQEMMPKPMAELAAFQLRKRGYTLSSIGYWGTSLRTLNEPNEFQLGSQDVTTAINFYSDANGSEPALLTISLGNHLTLSALGAERLERMKVLALVPVMDGLQHHLRRSQKENKALEEAGEPYGEYAHFHIYRRDSDGIQFDYRKLLAIHEHMPQYLGKADFPWRDVSLNHAFSSIVLGKDDPRTTDYLAANRDLPNFVQVWNTGHDLPRDNPEKTRKLYADFADCLTASAASA